MNSNQIQKMNVAMIVTFVAGISLSIAYGAYAIKESQTIDLDTKEVLISRLRGECAAGLKMSGMEIDLKETSLIAQSQRLTDPYVTLTKTSAAISQCTGFVLTEYCMGSECETAPVYFSLQAVSQ